MPYTFPTEKGGLSGPYLKKYNTKLINYISRNHSDAEIIAGGGIFSKEDVDYYKNLGAKHMSVSTLLFNPFSFYNFYIETDYFKA